MCGGICWGSASEMIVVFQHFEFQKDFARSSWTWLEFSGKSSIISVAINFSLKAEGGFLRVSSTLDIVSENDLVTHPV